MVMYSWFVSHHDIRLFFLVKSCGDSQSLCARASHVSVCLSEEMREYFGQFGVVKKCLLPFVSCHSINIICRLSYIYSPFCTHHSFCSYYSLISFYYSTVLIIVIPAQCLTFCCVFHQDKETGFHRGFCWVGFTTEEGLNNALQKDPHVLEGAKVKVTLSSSKAKVLWKERNLLIQHKRGLDCFFKA